jgi:uncharacterized RDD family membrane protein YckC
VSAVCFAHAERPGTPCLRCGTFACEQCLQGGRCGACAQGVAVKAPTPPDVVGFDARVFSRLIDSGAHAAMAVLGSVAAGVVLVVLAKLGLISEGWAQRLKLGVGLKVFVSISSTLVSTGVMNRVCGASLGKVLLKQRIVRLDGQRPRFIDGVARELGLFVDLFFFAAVAYSVMKASPLRQRVGDKWADTVVVRADAVSPAARASPTELAAGLALGLMLKAALTAIALVSLAR